MKVLSIMPAYFPAVSHGGPILSDHLRNKWLVKNGVQVTVYTTNVDGPGLSDVPLQKSVDVDGVKVIYFPISWKLWFYSSRLHASLARTVKDFDLVHITSVFLAASTFGAYYAKKFNKPYIISPRGNLMMEPLSKKSPLKKKIYIELIEKRNLRNASAVHFTAESEKQEYLKARLPLTKLLVIPNSFDGEEEGENNPAPDLFRKKFNISHDSKIVLSLGRLNWKKGFDTLIPAFSALLKEEPKTLLAIVGGDEGGYKKTIDKLIDEYDLQNRVIFTGSLLGENKVAAFKESDIFVLPSYSENFAMSVVEAMYYGLPVIISEGVGVAPLVAKSGAGIVLKKDVQLFSKAMSKLLRDEKLSAEMGSREKNLVKKEFSPDKVAKKFIEEYNNLTYGSKTKDF